MKITSQRRSSVQLLLCLLTICASQSGIAQEDREDEAVRQKLEAIARAETMIMVPMRDGVRLATDVYLPRAGEDLWPTIFVNDFNRIDGVGLEWRHQGDRARLCLRRAELRQGPLLLRGRVEDPREAAHNTVHHSTRYPTRIVLPVVPRNDQEE